MPGLQPFTRHPTYAREVPVTVSSGQLSRTAIRLKLRSELSRCSVAQGYPFGFGLGTRMTRSRKSMLHNGDSWAPGKLRQGFSLATKHLSKGCFRWWPQGTESALRLHLAQAERAVLTSSSTCLLKTTISEAREHLRHGAPSRCALAAFFRGDEVSGNQQNHAAAVSLRQKAEPATVKNNTPRVGAQCCHTSLGLTSGCRHFHLPAGESESFWRPSLVAAGITDGCEGGVRALTTPPDLFQQLVPVKFRLIDDNYSRFNNLAARAGFEPLWH